MEDKKKNSTKRYIAAINECREVAKKHNLNEKEIQIVINKFDEVYNQLKHSNGKSAKVNAIQKAREAAGRKIHSILSMSKEERDKLSINTPSVGNPSSPPHEEKPITNSDPKEMLQSNISVIRQYIERKRSKEPSLSRDFELSLERLYKKCETFSPMLTTGFLLEFTNNCLENIKKQNNPNVRANQFIVLSVKKVLPTIEGLIKKQNNARKDNDGPKVESNTPTREEKPIDDNALNNKIQSNIGMIREYIKGQKTKSFHLSRDFNDALEKLQRKCESFDPEMNKIFLLEFTEKCLLYMHNKKVQNYRDNLFIDLSLQEVVASINKYNKRQKKDKKDNEAPVVEQPKNNDSPIDNQNKNETSPYHEGKPNIDTESQEKLRRNIEMIREYIKSQKINSTVLSNDFDNALIMIQKRCSMFDSRLTSRILFEFTEKCLKRMNNVKNHNNIDNKFIVVSMMEVLSAVNKYVDKRNKDNKNNSAPKLQVPKNNTPKITKKQRKKTVAVSNIKNNVYNSDSIIEQVGREGFRDLRLVGLNNEEKEFFNKRVRELYSQFQSKGNNDLRYNIYNYLMSNMFGNAYRSFPRAASALHLNDVAQMINSQTYDLVITDFLKSLNKEELMNIVYFAISAETILDIYDMRANMYDEMNQSGERKR